MAPILLVAGASESRKRSASPVQTGRFAWDKLPELPFENICSFLRKDVNQRGLINLRQCSKTLKDRVDHYSMRPCNRPEIQYIQIDRGLNSPRDTSLRILEILVSTMQMPVHCEGIDWKRYHMDSGVDQYDMKWMIVKKGEEKFIALRANMRYPNHRLSDSLLSLLNGHALKVIISGASVMAIRCLRLTTIESLEIVDELILTNATGEKIKTLIAHSSVKQCSIVTEKSTLTDKAGFITGLNQVLSSPLGLKERGERTKTQRNYERMNKSQKTSETWGFLH